MKVSVLNLATLRKDETYKDAIDKMVRLAKKIESLGYERLWIAEHHNMKYIASSATQLLIQQALINTEKIRVGAGGVMLPNHSPYIVAEQYGTLETLFPGRVDLGLGRAPGTDVDTAMAIRRNTRGREFYFGDEIEEIQGYFKGTNRVHAYPAEGLDVPIYILGSTTDSAYLAAKLGLPYSFASHFAPGQMEKAVEIYRSNFKPSEYLEKPYVILGVNVILADTNEEAKKLSTTQLRMFTNIITGKSEGLFPPVENEDEVWKSVIEAKGVPHFGPVKFEADSLIKHEKAVVDHMSSIKFVGDMETAKEQIRELQKRVEFEEIMSVSYIYDEEAHLHSCELLAKVVSEI